MLAGGLFLLYKTEGNTPWLEGDEGMLRVRAATRRSALSVAQIIVIDMVFSFDSIITAVGLAQHVPIMIVAVIIAMIYHVRFSLIRSHTFIHKNPTLKIGALAFC